MKRLKRIILGLIVILFLFLGLWIAQDNPQTVDVILLGFALKPLSLGMWLLITLAVGVVLGMLASLPVIFRNDAENRRLRQKAVDR